MPTPTQTDVIAVAPEIILAAAAGLVLLLEAYLPSLRRYFSELTMVAVGCAIWARLTLDLPGAVWSGMLRVDQLTAFVDTYILIAVGLAIWISGPFLRRCEAEHGEFFALMLLASTGAMVMASALDLLPIFLGLELLSIPLYALNAFLSRHQVSIEAGLKYFVVGAFASAFVAYGIALLYGASGSTNLAVIGHRVIETGFEFLLLSKETVTRFWAADRG